MAEASEETTKSDLILQEIMRRKEQERTVDVEELRVKMVVFSLGGELYAFYGESIREILPNMPVSYVPGAPDFIPGVINVRGEIESVISINRFLELPDPASTREARIAVAERNGIRSGILVDTLEDVLDIPYSAVRPPLATLSPAVKEFVSGEFLLQHKTVTILDIGKIFGKIGA